MRSVLIVGLTGLWVIGCNFQSKPAATAVRFGAGERLIALNGGCVENPSELSQTKGEMIFEADKVVLKVPRGSCVEQIEYKSQWMTETRLVLSGARAREVCGDSRYMPQLKQVLRFERKGEFAKIYTQSSIQACGWAKVEKG